MIPCGPPDGTAAVRLQAKDSLLEARMSVGFVFGFKDERYAMTSCNPCFTKAGKGCFGADLCEKGEKKQRKKKKKEQK